MAELKRLTPDVAIGKIKGKENGEVREYDIMYGNILNPVYDDNPKIINRDLYMKKLEEFFDSPEGEEYERPSDEQIERDCQTVYEQVADYKRRVKEERLREEEERRAELERNRKQREEDEARVRSAYGLDKNKEDTKTKKSKETSKPINLPPPPTPAYDDEDDDDDYPPYDDDDYDYDYNDEETDFDDEDEEPVKKGLFGHRKGAKEKPAKEPKPHKEKNRVKYDEEANETEVPADMRWLKPCMIFVTIMLFIIMLLLIAILIYVMGYEFTFLPA